LQVEIRFSDEDSAFRVEVRQFLAESFDDNLKSKLLGVEASPHYREAILEWQRRLNNKGWMAPAWPVEYGGQNWSATQHYIFNSERSEAGVPPILPFGVTMLGPVIYTYGNEGQKARFLPSILNSEIWWCQGYSEPGAGSDLAALQCRAERDGDEYVVNGSKIWTTFAQYADWIFCLVSTDNSGRKQEGISFLLIDLSTPGVTIRPIDTIDGMHHLNEVFFDNVRVPVENRIGEEGMGWTYAKSLLVHERLSMAEVSESKRNLDDLRTLARSECNGGFSLLDNHLFAKRLTDIEIDLMALEYTELRVLASAAEGRDPGPESSLLKLQGTSIQQAIQELRMDVAGYLSTALHGNLEPATSTIDAVEMAQKLYFRGRAASIYGGSSEVQKNITARAVLGL
jgi:alkylation response protein AidB-like acyl-CoA dehydrogenase